MEAISTNKKTYQLLENGQRLGELLYENLFLLKAEIQLPDAESYEIKPQGVFKTSISILKNGIELANFKMNWRGQIEFVFNDGQEFILKGKGFFHNKYTLENKEGKKIIEIIPDFIWRKFRYNYNVSYNEPLDNFLVLVVIYAINYVIATSSSASSGMG